MSSKKKNTTEDVLAAVAKKKRKERRHRLTRGFIALIVVGCILVAILLTAFIAWIAFLYVDATTTVWSPDYDMLDEDSMNEILDRYYVDGEELTDDDYDTLYAQTGLTKAGIDRALAKGEDGRERIFDIQEDYFGTYAVEHNKFAPYVCTDYLESGYIQNIYLEPGDILVTSSTHITGWRMGHCGIVTSSTRAMQAMAYGTPTYEASISYFTGRVNFMVLSPKTDSETKQAAADIALGCKGVEYNAFAGIFSKKNSMDHGTQCSHLVWYSYYQLGIDLDSDGGPLVTPCDLARSDQVELVQVFGFDPVKLW